jgi:hypothetical protein
MKMLDHCEPVLGIRADHNVRFCYDVWQVLRIEHFN